MIPSKHILFEEAQLVLVDAGALPVKAAAALAPFRFVLSCQVLVQRAKLAELLDDLERSEGSEHGC